MKNLFLYLLLISQTILFSQKGLDRNTIYLLIKMDDVGMCHAANLGAEKVMQTGMPVNAGLQVPCSWYPEAVELVKKYPNVAVGLHMAINAEWKNYKWRPVAGFQNVPSLVDKQGYFHHENLWWWKDSIKKEDLERELAAQAQAVKLSGIQVDYVEGHMGSSRTTPMFMEAYEKIAKEFNAMMTGYNGEKRLSFKNTTYEEALREILAKMDTLKKGNIYLLTIHPGAVTDEMKALALDDKESHQESIARERDIDVQVICSPEFKAMIEKKKIKVINYREVKELTGISYARP